MDARQVIQELGGRGTKTRCLCHDEKTPSLEAKDMPDGSVMLTCFAGCERKDLYQAVRDRGININPLPERDREDYTPPTYSTLTEVCRYLYCKPDGTEYANKIRFVDASKRKTFRWEGLNGNRGDTHIPILYLYRCPELRNSKTILWLEGEKDVDTAFDLGYVATCVGDGAAGKWKSDYKSQLAGVTEVIIIPDNDDVGRAHADRIRTGIQSAGIASRIVTLPRGKDLTEFIHDHGGSRKELDALIIGLDNWPALMPLNETFGPDVNTNVLPSPLKEMADAVAESTQTPAGMSVLTILGVLATCFQRKYIVAPFGLSGSYRESLSLWTLCCMAPGTRKTAVSNAITKPIVNTELELTSSMQSQIIDNEIERKLAQRRIDALSKKHASEKDQHERTAIEAEIKELTLKLQKHVVAPRFFTTDTTPETLKTLLANHNERMACISDDAGGIFATMTGLYTNGNANIDVFLQAQSGSPVRVDRQNSSTQLVRPAFTFALALQPGILESVDRNSKGRFGHSGLLGRFLYLVPDDRVGSREFGNNIPIPAPVQCEYEALISHLLKLPDSDIPMLVELEPKALRLWKRFGQHMEELMKPQALLCDMRDWAAKLPGMVLRIATLCHLAETRGEATPVPEVAIARATLLANDLIDHAALAYSMMKGETSHDSDCATIIRHLEQLKQEERTSITRRDLNRIPRFLKNAKTGERLNGAIQRLVDLGYLSAPDHVGKSTLFHVSPRVYL